MKFEPISYEHAAYLTGKRPWDVSRDCALLVSAHLEAMRTYKSNTCIVGIDIYNVEAEAYGCKIEEPDKTGVPVFREPLVESVDEMMALQLNPAHDGRMPMILRVAQQIAEERPDADIRIPLSGPFTIACHLLGLENMICEIFMNPEPCVSALMHLAGNQILYGRTAVEHGFGITFFESSVTPPLLSPQLFSEKVLPSLKKILTNLSDCEPDIQFIIGGDTVHLAHAISSLQASYIICPVETDQERFMSIVACNPEMKVRINMNPSVFLPGNHKAALDEAKRTFNIARKYQNTSIGTLLPFDADSDIVNEISDFLINSHHI